MVEVGNRVELASAKVERRPRSGVVTAVRGPMITVRWDTGEQSTVVPASGTLSVLGHKTKSTGQTAKKAAGKTASATDKAASRAAKAVEGRSAKAAKAAERGGARSAKALKKSAGRAAKAVEASASKAEKAVDKAGSKAAGHTRKSPKRAR